MLRKIFLAAMTAMGFYVSNAQDSTIKVSYSGGLDGYYRYNFNNQPNNFTSFTNSQSSFELGMATLKADATALSGKVGATIDLGFGRRAEEFSYNDGEAKNGFASLSLLKQAYITYAPTKKLKFTAGKFTTHVGYEMLDAQLNKNYSMSYMFTNGPFFHTGIKAEYNITGPLSFMVGIANYVDQTIASTSAKNAIAQISYTSKSEKVKAYLNYSGFAGSDSGANPSALKSIHQIDVVVNTVINKKLSLGYNGTIQLRDSINAKKGNWMGNALYATYDYNNKIGLSGRSELITDAKNSFFSIKHIWATTLSLNYKVGPLTIIPELRYETASSNFYLKEDGSGTRSTASGLVAVVYKF
jgi:Putative beta-barrel porin-2, OmpL-like. bbp2